GNGARGARGVYYTPEPLVEELVRATVEPTAQEFLAARPTAVAETTLPRILDPAMGSGHFLVCAARCLGDVLTAAHMRAGDSPLVDEGSGQQAAGGFSLLPAALQPAQDARSAAPGRAEAVLPASRRALRRLVAERCLFGVDLHPAAADLARLCLWLECSEPGAPLRLPETRLRAGESLLGVDWAREHPSGFDVVLGNPPWGAELGLERARLRRAYASARGEIESAALFIELALRLCRPGGRVGLVTPNTWLTLVRQAGLRHSVLEAGRLELLVEQAPGAFAGVRSVVPLAFVLRRGPGAPPGPTLVRGPHGEHLAEQEVWRRAEGAVIDLRLGRAARRVLERIDARSEPLGAVARVAYGIKTGDNAANLACEPLSTEHRPALADGAEVRRHAIAWGGRFLRYGPHLAGYRRAPVDVPKIVVQYIRNLGLPQRLVAAVDERGAYYPLNNFSYITATGPYDLFYLAALLCSSPLNAVFAGRYRDYNIKPAYLRRLPIRRVAFTTPPALRAALLAEALALPEDDLLAFVERRLAAIPEQADVVHDLLAALARRLAALHRQPPGTPPAGADAASRTDALIDAIVLRLYGLDAADMAALGDTASSAAAHTDAPIGPTPGAMP
ncbi:MAG TPA: N-6 DNA methylase, partial [Roseiflexaceae bacterium]|nr:N-6 DNA methylase [Roseiflexaceae bacterium]